MRTWKVAEPERLTLEGKVRDLKVYLVGGRLNVVGAEGPSRVEVTAISDKPVTVTLDDDGVLSVRHDDVPGRRGLLWWIFAHRFKADISIVVPVETHANLQVVLGSIIASTLRAGAEVNVTNGRITLLGLDGDITAKIVTGPIEALSIGGRVELETVSGEIVLADSTARRVHARTISGSVTCDLDNPPADTDVRLETVSGGITARVREDSDLQVRLSTASGSLLSAFPELAPQSRWSTSGRLGTGTGQLAAIATSGSISLLRRPVDNEPPEDPAEEPESDVTA